MISTSDNYKAAIDAPTRRIVPKAVIDLTDPDLVVSSVTGDYLSNYSFPSQLTDRDTTYSGLVFVTLEQNRWLLDGSQHIMPSTPSTRDGEQGVIGDTLSGADATDDSTLKVTMGGVDTLQIITMACTGLPCDGVPVNCTLNIYSSGMLLYTSTEDVTPVYQWKGFTVVQPTEIEVVVNEWSLPKRRYRFVEFLPGIVETWGGEVIYKMNVIHKADFSNLTLPSASASLEIDNTPKRFDPSELDSLFLSVTARQPIPLWYGVDTGGSVEYVPLGVFYQKNEGWHIENNGLTICWDLVDIIGLLAERKYEEKTQKQYHDYYHYLLPIEKTLTGWIEALLDQLDPAFDGHYYIDPSLGNPDLSCIWDDVENISCGDMLRHICQATNSYPVCDPVTGYLDIKPLNNEPQQIITLRSQNSLPGSQKNTDIAFLNYSITPLFEWIEYEGEWYRDPINPSRYETTAYNIPGTEEISDKVVSIKNPFIQSTMHAAESAEVVLSQYGGNVLNVMCRGDMSREVGDVETVEIYPNQMVSGRIMEQQLTLENGIMTNTLLKMLQANGGQMYTDYILIKENGTYQLPSGVTQITLVLIGGGDGGDGGGNGARRDGIPGAGGKGGKVYSTPVAVNDGQTFTVSIGQGGAGGRHSGGYPVVPVPGEPGTPGDPTTVTFSTTFSSENGIHFDTGYVDLLTNSAYGIPGADGQVQRPIQEATPGVNGTGNGGGGGNGGARAITETIYYEDGSWETILITPSEDGTDGARGGSGCVIIFYARDTE